MSTWISRRPAAEVAVELDAATGPLAGLTVAVKDNIDVAGLPTTAGCPAYEYEPMVDAVAVARLRAAGAVVVGKTNLDQFATGLVGTRSPYGTVADARRPEYVAGGSSSGSAVAVARGEVDLALGTDTAGSGRVPAAFQGVVGAKPSIGLIPTEGVVPACRSFDCVSVFARSVELAACAVEVMAGRGEVSTLRPSVPGSSAPGSSAPAPRPRLAVFPETALSAMSSGYREAFAGVLAAARADGISLTEIDPEPFLAAGELLYGGAFVAERYAAVGPFIEAHRTDCDPIVASIVLAAREISAADYLRDLERLSKLRALAAAALGGCDGLLTPTAPFQPTLAEVTAEPVAVNRALGAFTSFCNMLDLCAYAVPAGEADRGHFGVSVLAPSGHDAVAAALAARIERLWAAAIPLLVVGAHMSGMTLNRELTERGGRLLGPVSTAPCYRLFALDTEPPKPGLVRVAEGEDGASIAGELWALAPDRLAELLAALPHPMTLGRVALADGREVVGFLCEPVALEGAAEITVHGGWRPYVVASR